LLFQDLIKFYAAFNDLLIVTEIVEIRISDGVQNATVARHHGQGERMVLVEVNITMH